MTKISTMNVKGQSGTAYSFDFYPMGTTFRTLGAVYIVTKRVKKPDGGGSHTYLYVGETGHLSTRFDDHDKQDCFDKRGANCIGVHLDSTKQSRLDKEDDLLLGKGWPCND